MTPRWNKYISLLNVAMVLVVAGLAWQVLSALQLWTPYVFPSPSAIGRRLWELMGEGYLLPSLLATLARMGIGFLISAVMGLGIGLVVGLSPSVSQTLKALFLGLQTLPSAAWVPIALMLWGLNDRAVYFVIVMSSMPAIAVATADGIAHIPPIYIRAARTLGTPRWAMAHRVVLPAALPNIVTGLKLGWTLGWHGAVSAELIKSTIGLGFLLHMGRELNDAAQVVGIMLVTITVGLLVDRLVFARLDRRVRMRWGLVTESPTQIP